MQRTLYRSLLFLMLVFSCAFALAGKAMGQQKTALQRRSSPEQIAKIQPLLQEATRQQATNPQAAVKILTQAIEIAPQEAQLYLYRGRIYFVTNNLALAKADFNRAVELNPTMAMAYLFRGAVALNQQLLEEAENNFLTAVRLDPKDYNALLNLAIVQNLLKKYPEAIAAISKAIRIKPKEGIAYYERANIYRSHGKYRESVQDYQKAIQINPKNWDAYINSATSKGLLEDYQGAIDDYNYLIANQPPNKTTLYNRGYVYFILKQYDKAIEDISKALGVDSSFKQAEILRLLSWQQMGKVREALEQARTILQTNPQDAQGFTNAGGQVRALLQENEFINAEVFFRRHEIRASMGDERGACRDISKAEVLGYPNIQPKRLGVCLTMGRFTAAANFPENLQFFPRGNNDSAFVPLVGLLTEGGFDSVYVQLYKNGVFERRTAKALQYNYILRGTETIPQSPISTGISIHAELAEYSVKLGLKSALRDTIIATADSLVCGDVILVSGQSNTVLGALPRTPHNEFLRTYQMGYNDSYWGFAAANNNRDDYNVGGFALQLQERLAAKHNVPICVINGGLSASTIEQHYRDDAKPTNPKSWYGRMFWRAKESGLARAAKAMIWYQGESNQGAGYTEKFAKLYQAWKQDYPGLKKIYTVQIHTSNCGQSDQAILREQQRLLPQRFPDVEVVASAGLPAHDGCHYGNEGYIALGNQLYAHLAQDFYGGTDSVGTQSPNLLRAYWKDATRKTIALVFATNDSLTISKDTSIGGKIRTLAADAFLLDGKPLKAASVQIENNTTVVVTLAMAQNAQTISYIPDHCYTGSPEAPCELYQGPWLMTRRGVGALTFHNILIEAAP